jgi:hypothetical protein
MLNLLALKMTGKGSREPKGGIAEEFWQYSWRQASLEAVFGEKQFDLQTMLDQFRQYLQKNNPNSSAVLVGFHISDNRWSDFSQGIRAQWKEVNEL